MGDGVVQQRKTPFLTISRSSLGSYANPDIVFDHFSLISRLLCQPGHAVGHPFVIAYAHRMLMGRTHLQTDDMPHSPSVTVL